MKRPEGGKMRFEAKNGIVNLSAKGIVEQDGWDIIIQLDGVEGVATIKQCEDGSIGAGWCDSASKWVSPALYWAAWETGDFVEVLDYIEKLAVETLEKSWQRVDQKHSRVVQAWKELCIAEAHLNCRKRALEGVWEWCRESIKPNHYPRSRRMADLMRVYDQVAEAEEVMEIAEEKYKEAYKDSSDVPYPEDGYLVESVCDGLRSPRPNIYTREDALGYVTRELQLSLLELAEKQEKDHRESLLEGHIVVWRCLVYPDGDVRRYKPIECVLEHRIGELYEFADDDDDDDDDDDTARLMCVEALARLKDMQH